ncbi:MAG: YfiR family protein [Gammaproteobacteria bacterium]|nr:YfiR family protein [Gammaproteobacteria bacterium]
MGLSRSWWSLKRLGSGPGRRLCAWLLALLLAPPVLAVGEDEVKAAFLAKFGHYVSWPADRAPGPDRPLVIGVLGRASFIDLLRQRAREESARGPAMQVRRLGSLDDAQGVHILFIGAQALEPQALRQAGLRACLLVGDSNGFLDEGGMIRLTTDNNRIRFDIDVDAAERAGLKFSAKLLKLAREVRGK